MSTPAPNEPTGGQIPYGYAYPAAGYPSAPASGYPGQPYGYAGAPPGYGAPRPRNGLAITSMVLGIVAVITCWLSVPGMVLGILAVIFGGVGLARARNDRVSNKGMAIAGLVMGVVAMIIGTVVLVFAIQVSSQCLEQYGPNATDQELAQCVQDQITE